MIIVRETTPWWSRPKNIPTETVRREGADEVTVFQDFHRFKRLAPYVDAEVYAPMAAARAGGAALCDLGMVTPEMPTPRHSVDKLGAAVR